MAWTGAEPTEAERGWSADHMVEFSIPIAYKTSENGRKFWVFEPPFTASETNILYYSPMLDFLRFEANKTAKTGCIV